ncbi:hypothetical protein [Sinosporangium siamense]|uniref:Uncharacterized protein n=1 Tax=Sinosporangium siamense TaxID=1367973 RepID=A0A919RN93_9ACTN|nr:hypothetical protein [Sinosporangium siamense]GII95579.1 hypothetical protein Ssi02_58100 [Sinosporangium siamense]
MQHQLVMLTYGLDGLIESAQPDDTSAAEKIPVIIYTTEADEAATKAKAAREADKHHDTRKVSRTASGDTQDADSQDTAGTAEAVEGIAVLKRAIPRRAARAARAGARMAHSAAMFRLRRAGLGWRSSRGCSHRWLRWCTSLETMRRGTLTEVIRLKRRSGCPIIVTGGTEVGHAPGPFSHGAGYKVDIAQGKCINRYINRKYRYIRTRGDGARLYRDRDGDIYAREPSHWDILVT